MRERVNSGREFLFGHVCADGGWNHGSNQALGRDGDSYPETTGIALTALARVPQQDKAAKKTIERAKKMARQHLATCRTAEGTAWLRMGLTAHGEPVALQTLPPPRTTLDAALTSISTSSRNPLVS
jgi:hypothetical protein